MSWRRGRAYGQDLRDRVLAVVGASVREVAARFGVSPSYVVKARARQRDLGQATPGAQRNHVPAKLASLHDALRSRVSVKADATLAELRAWTVAEHGVSVSHKVMWKTIRQLGLTLKKTYGPPRLQAICHDMIWSVYANVSGLRDVALAKMEIRTFRSS